MSRSIQEKLPGIERTRSRRMGFLRSSIGSSLKWNVIATQDLSEILDGDARRAVQGTEPHDPHRTDGGPRPPLRAFFLEVPEDKDVVTPAEIAVLALVSVDDDNEALDRA